MLLMIDNYDSFTYNLVQYFYELGQEVEVYRNDQISIEDIEKKNPKYLVISPGPCTPKEAGISVEIIKSFKDQTLVVFSKKGYFYDKISSNDFKNLVLFTENVKLKKVLQLKRNYNYRINHLHYIL